MNIMIAVLIGAVIALVVVTIAVVPMTKALLKLYRREAVVPEGFVALLFRNGRLQRTLEPGRYVFYGRHVVVQPVETRTKLLDIKGQEVLTRDQMVVKVSAVVEYAVADAEKAMRASTSYVEALYHIAQHALRTVIGGRALEQVLSERAGLDAALLPLVTPGAAELGVTVRAVVLKDFMLSGELKAAYADVAKAKLETEAAQERARSEANAALERARGESAALRNLANATRSFGANPGLYQLRQLQALEAALANGPGTTLVIGLTPEQAGLIQTAKRPG